MCGCSDLIKKARERRRRCETNRRSARTETDRPFLSSHRQTFDSPGYVLRNDDDDDDDDDDDT